MTPRSSNLILRNRGGRPPIVFGPHELAQVERLAGYGLTEAAIAHVLGIGARTLRTKKHAAEVSAALARGRAQAEAKVGEALYRKALKGDMQAIRWWEITRAGRSERPAPEIEDIPRPIFYLPALGSVPVPPHPEAAR